LFEDLALFNSFTAIETQAQKFLLLPIVVVSSEHLESTVLLSLLPLIKLLLDLPVDGPLEDRYPVFKLELFLPGVVGMDLLEKHPLLGQVVLFQVVSFKPLRIIPSFHLRLGKLVGNVMRVEFGGVLRERCDVASITRVHLVVRQTKLPIFIQFV